MISYFSLDFVAQEIREQNLSWWMLQASDGWSSWKTIGVFGEEAEEGGGSGGERAAEALIQKVMSAWSFDPNAQFRVVASKTKKSNGDQRRVYTLRYNSSAANPQQNNPQQGYNGFAGFGGMQNQLQGFAGLGQLEQLGYVPKSYVDQTLDMKTKELELRFREEKAKEMARKAKRRSERLAQEIELQRLKHENWINTTKSVVGIAANNKPLLNDVLGLLGVPFRLPTEAASATASAPALSTLAQQAAPLVASFVAPQSAPLVNSFVAPTQPNQPAPMMMNFAGVEKPKPYINPKEEEELAGEEFEQEEEFDEVDELADEIADAELTEKQFERLRNIIRNSIDKIKNGKKSKGFDEPKAETTVGALADYSAADDDGSGE